MSEAYQIICLKNFKWRRNQSSQKPGDIVRLKVQDILDVPESISFSDALEMTSLNLAKLYESEDDLEDMELDISDEDDLDNLDDSDLDEEDIEYTHDEVLDKLREVKKEKGNDAAKEIMTKFGYSAMKDITAEHYAEIYTECESLLIED